MGARVKAFTGEKLTKMHKEAFPEEDKLPKFGYPDLGCGRYSDALPYKDWFEMNTG
jgi:hypothetical protein